MIIGFLCLIEVVFNRRYSYYFMHFFDIIYLVFSPNYPFLKDKPKEVVSYHIMSNYIYVIIHIMY